MRSGDVDVPPREEELSGRIKAGRDARRSRYTCWAAKHVHAGEEALTSFRSKFIFALFIQYWRAILLNGPILASFCLFLSFPHDTIQI